MSVSLAGKQVSLPTAAWLVRLMPVASLSLVYAVAAAIYSWQALDQKSPWIFPDETQHAQTAAAIAGSSSGAIAPIPGILYSVLIAPAWLLHGQVTSYDAAKLIGVLVMCTAAIPAYLLARLLVRPPLALVAAIAVVAIPGMFYSSLLMQEALAYPYATLVFYLLTRALLRDDRLGLALAFAIALLGPLIRTELVVLPLVVLVAVILHVWFGDWARRQRARWTPAHWVLAAGVFVCALAAAVALGAAVSTAWHTALDHPLRVLRYAVLALVPLTVGLGILPVLAAPATLWAGRGRRRPVRAFAAVFAAGAVVLLLYVGAKEAFLAARPDVYGTVDLLGERNLIYLSPLVLVGLVVWIESRRVNRAVLLVAGALLVAMLAWIPYVFAYLSAPHSPTVVAIAHLSQELGWSHDGVRYGLVVVTVLAAVALTGRSRALAAAAVVVVGWSLTAEIYASNMSREIGAGIAGSQPRPLDWIDRATGGRPALYLGEGGLRAPEIFALGFWNPVLTRYWGLQTTPGSGFVPVTRVVSTDGRLGIQPRASYVVADRQIELDGERITSAKRWDLYRISRPLRLRAFQAGLWEDGWMGSASSYARFSTPGGRTGHVRVLLSQRAWCGPDVGARASVSVGTLADAGGALSIAHVTGSLTTPIHACRAVSVKLPTPPPPFRVEVHIAPTFVPAKLDPHSVDIRHLGAQVAFRFTTGG